MVSIGHGQLDSKECGLVCGKAQLVVESMEVLEILLESGLTLQPLLDRLAQKFEAGVGDLVNKVISLGFSLPYACAQFAGRVENATLYGYALLVCYAVGYAVGHHGGRQLSGFSRRGVRVVRLVPIGRVRMVRQRNSVFLETWMVSVFCLLYEGKIHDWHA